MRFPTLIVLAGLPGVGKTTIARALARVLNAVHIRIDSIEQGIRESALAADTVEDAGYRAAYAVAEDNLRLAHIVIADSVNPLPVTRAAWLDVARRAGVRAVQVEVVCSDRNEHRRRVERRGGEIGVAGALTWQEVVERDYREWSEPRLVVDASAMDVDGCVRAIANAVTDVS
jgi:predicted kinase